MYMYSSQIPEFSYISSHRRNVYYKHRDAGLHGALPYVLATVIMDIPFVLVESFIFVTLVFWMTGSYAWTICARYWFVK